MLTAEQKKLLTCEDCGANVLDCACSTDCDQYEAALELYTPEIADEIDDFDPRAEPENTYPAQQWVFQQLGDGRIVAMSGEDNRLYDISEPIKFIPMPPWPNTSQQPKPTPRAPLDEKQKAAADGISRAVERLNSRELRYGCAEWGA